MARRRGFKIADAYVEVRAYTDRDQFRREAVAASRAAGQAGGEAGAKEHNEAAQGGLSKGAGKVASAFWSRFGKWLTTPSQSVLTAIRTGVPRALGSPIGLAAVAVAAIFIGAFVSAVLSSAALAALGAGIAAVGVAAISQATEFQEAWTSAATRVRASLLEAARSLLGPLTEAADTFATYVDMIISPRLRNMFVDLAPAIDDLLVGALNGLNRFLAAVQPHMQTLSQDFLGPLGDQIERVGIILGEFMVGLMQDSDEILEATRKLVDLLEQFLAVLLPVIRWLVRLWNTLMDVAQVAEEVVKRVGLGGLVMEKLGFWADDSSDKLNKMTGETDSAGNAMSGFAGETRGAGSAVTTMGGAIDIARTSMSAAIDELGSLRDVIERFTTGSLDARAAERRLQEALDSGTEALEEHGLTMDTTTEAGRQIQGAIDQVAESVIAKAQATFDATEADHGAAAAQEAANQVLEQGRKQLIDMLEPYADSREAARALANQILQTPEEWSTDMNTPGILDRIQEVKDYIREINNIPDSETVTITTRRVNQHIVEEYGVNASRVNRFGNVHFAQQGLVSMGQSQMFPPGNETLFGFREPDTGGEAFVARNAPRDRSLDILEQAAQWHQAAVVPRENMAQQPTPEGDTYNYFEPGAITIDTSRIRDFDDLLELVNELRQSARRKGANV